jgi:hypothetical protein
MPANEVSRCDTCSSNEAALAVARPAELRFVQRGSAYAAAAPASSPTVAIRMRTSHPGRTTELPREINKTTQLIINDIISKINKTNKQNINDIN